MSQPARTPDMTEEDGALRLIGIAFRKYTTEPETRRSAASMMLTSALRLYAGAAGLKAAARIVLQVIEQLAEEQKP